MLYPFEAYPIFLLSLLAIYWLAPAVYRRHVLWVASLGLITFLSWRSTGAFLMLAAFVYLVGRRLEREGPGRARTALMMAGLAVPLLYLFTFKYLPEYSPPIRAFLRLFAGAELLLPLGISYFTFKFLHYVIEARRGTLPPHDWWDFLTYSSLFSIFAAGPIERFTGLQPQLHAPTLSRDDLVAGIERIFHGIVKKVILADFVMVAFLGHVAVARENPASASTLTQCIYFWSSFLHLYFDFSGYSDLAIGTSRLFGLKIIENFNWPLFRRNISEFWRSWHMSLSGWCRDYVFFPVVGSTRNPKLAAYASMAVIGYWHGADPKWLCWGAWHGTGLAVWQMWQTFKSRRPVLQRVARENPVYRVAAVVLSFNYVAVGLIWSVSDSLPEAVRFYYYLVTP
jgi:alginate O-acetyltransferase complex protein AlgI